jgi:hypothetical protein
MAVHGMDVNPRICMFCQDDLPRRGEEPVNLAFMAHVETSGACREAFAVWRTHMQRDFLGD